jgi:hypothetical protein
MIIRTTDMNTSKNKLTTAKTSASLSDNSHLASSKESGLFSQGGFSLESQSSSSAIRSMKSIKNQLTIHG